MANKSFGTLRGEQPAFTADGNTLIAAELTDGNSRVLTIDELSLILSGSTVQQNISTSIGGCSLQVDITKTGTTLISWDSAIYDNSGYYSGAAPTRITIPAGITKGIFRASVEGNTEISIIKNGVTTIAKGTKETQSHIVPVNSGDYFEVVCTTAITITAADGITGFSFEAKELTA